MRVRRESGGGLGPSLERGSRATGDEKRGGRKEEERERVSERTCQRWFRASMDENEGREDDADGERR